MKRTLHRILDRILFEIVTVGLLLLLFCFDFPLTLSRWYCGAVIVLALLRIVRKWRYG